MNKVLLVSLLIKGIDTRNSFVISLKGLDSSKDLLHQIEERAEAAGFNFLNTPLIENKVFLDGSAKTKDPPKDIQPKEGAKKQEARPKPDKKTSKEAKTSKTTSKKQTTSKSSTSKTAKSSTSKSSTSKTAKSSTSKGTSKTAKSSTSKSSSVTSKTPKSTSVTSKSVTSSFSKSSTQAKSVPSSVHPSSATMSSKPTSSVEAGPSSAILSSVSHTGKYPIVFTYSPSKSAEVASSSIMISDSVIMSSTVDSMLDSMSSFASSEIGSMPQSVDSSAFSDSLSLQSASMSESFSDMNSVSMSAGLYSTGLEQISNMEQNQIEEILKDCKECAKVDNILVYKEGNVWKDFTGKISMEMKNGKLMDKSGAFSGKDCGCPKEEIPNMGQLGETGIYQDKAVSKQQCQKQANYMKKLAESNASASASIGMLESASIGISESASMSIGGDSTSDNRDFSESSSDNQNMNIGGAGVSAQSMGNESASMSMQSDGMGAGAAALGSQPSQIEAQSAGMTPQSAGMGSQSVGPSSGPAESKPNQVDAQSASIGGGVPSEISNVQSASQPAVSIAPPQSEINPVQQQPQAQIPQSVAPSTEPHSVSPIVQQAQQTQEIPMVFKAIKLKYDLHSDEDGLEQNRVKTAYRTKTVTIVDQKEATTNTLYKTITRMVVPETVSKTFTQILRADTVTLTQKPDTVIRFATPSTVTRIQQQPAITVTKTVVKALQQDIPSEDRIDEPMQKTIKKRKGDVYSDETVTISTTVKRKNRGIECAPDCPCDSKGTCDNPCMEMRCEIIED